MSRSNKTNQARETSKKGWDTNPIGDKRVLSHRLECGLSLSYSRPVQHFQDKHLLGPVPRSRIAWSIDQVS